MVIREILTLLDQHGEGLTGQTLIAYPAGTVANGTTATDLGTGEYELVIDPLGNNAKMSKYYDIYIDGVLKQRNKFFQNWEWKVANKEIRKETTLVFADLTDENGDALPTTITNAEIILLPKADRLGLISAITDTNFTINVSTAGGADYGVFDIIIKKTK